MFNNIFYFCVCLIQFDNASIMTNCIMGWATDLKVIAWPRKQVMLHMSSGNYKI